MIYDFFFFLEIKRIIKVRIFVFVLLNNYLLFLFSVTSNIHA